jgi:hypothetical protein
MLRVDPNQVTPDLRALFDPGEPAALRCFAVLDGTLAGVILADRLPNPAWAVAQEGMNGTIYLGGQIDAALIAQVVAELRRAGDVLIGLWPDDPRRAWLPPNPDYEGRVLEWYDRPLGEGLEPFLAAVPPGCTIRPIDAEILPRCQWYAEVCREMGSAARFFQLGLGYCLLRGDEVLCEAYAGPDVQGVWELGVITQEAHRGRGYATITCAHLVHACEAQGHQTYWNTNLQNLASAAVARKLGYRVERQYRLWAWNKQ